MRKTAFAYWEDRIAPVFDVADQVMVVASESGDVSEREQAVFPDQMPLQKALVLKELGVSHLVCGAISRPMQETLMANGIEVHPFVSGALDDVIEASLQGDLEEHRFSMPGCRRRGMGGRGAGRLSRARCVGGRGFSEAEGTCMCPKCTHREPHERGVPCFERRCPECGIPLMRA